VLSLARVLHFASVIICLIVVASFALFAINQTNSASAHQQQTLNEGLPPSAVASRPGNSSLRAGGSGHANATSGPHKSAIRKALDEASSTLTSPFSEAFAGSGSEWAKRGVRLLLALAVYGFGLGYLARIVRVRA
jgi:hypothetical protein